ncbi:MAG: stage 0 sporulation family protein [Clostridia bacterium]|nr:stage 0 sporulation family protein [Clostridia bacterium]
MHQNFGAPETTEIIGVRFRETGKVYYFAPGEIKAEPGSQVIVETARGLEFGEVMIGNKFVPTSEIVPPLRSVVRIANTGDIERHEANLALEKNAFDICMKKIREHKLDMKLIDAEYTFDNNKLLFYFSAEGRVDFRELVKDLASVFRTRIELRQIGIRDEAKMMGGIGVCGRPFCCSTFLSDFAQVSIKMAKEQNLSLNSAKISGTCGRLMCCLNYEYQTYEEELRLTPPVGTRVKTPDGNGIVTEITPLTGMLKVSVSDRQGNSTVHSFHRDTVTVLKLPEKKDGGRNSEEKNSASKKTSADHE